MSVYYAYEPEKDSDVEHYGIKDMKWGVRRFQDKNGKLTPAGKIRYGVSKLTGSGAFKDAMDFQKAKTYYSSWANSHQETRNDELKKAAEWEAKLNRVKKNRADYAASPSATSAGLAEYDKEIARIEKIIKMYSEPDMYTSPENIAREKRAAKRMELNAKASDWQFQNAPLKTAAKNIRSSTRESADRFVETAAKGVKKAKNGINDILENAAEKAGKKAGKLFATFVSSAVSEVTKSVSVDDGEKYVDSLFGLTDIFEKKVKEKYNKRS